MKIEKGMFIRTQQGIARIVEKPNISVVVWNDRKVIYVDKNGHPVPTSFNFFVFEDEITAFSFNIIDLIEVGDYVNGEKVTSAEPVYEKDTDRYLGFGDYDYYIHTSEDIKNIVTKEQFNACKYVVKGDK